MDEKDFVLLRVLDETRNITRAADQLYITQSALSKRIKVIERELGVSILLRSRQGIRFTPAGEAVLTQTTAAARELDELRRTLLEMGDEVSGTLNAGISINYAQYRLPDTLAAYHRRFPKVRLHITTGQSRHLYRQFLDGTLDVAILRGEYPWDGERFLLSQEQICVICNQEFENKPLSQLLYISHKTDPALAGLLSQRMRDNELSNDKAGICVDNITTCVEMVRRGLGWGLLPNICLGDYNGCIRPCIFANGEPFVRRTYILFAREALRLPQVAAFIEMIKKNH